MIFVTKEIEEAMKRSVLKRTNDLDRHQAIYLMITIQSTSFMLLIVMLINTVLNKRVKKCNI